MPGGGPETIRFSVESLLYYAPRLTALGQDLASAESTAQKQLLGLGSFWGGSWPDQPFAKAYAPTQYAALIMVGQLAIEIQGIGGGVEQMARNYGITEDTNTQDVERIGVDSLIDATPGALNPPAKSLALPVASVPEPHPDTEPNAPPGSTPAPSPSHPAATSAVSPSPSPTGSPTPSPEPGPAAVAPKSWQVASIKSLLGPWPTGNPNSMDEAAGYWGTLISQLDDTWAGLMQITDYIMADAEGPAANAFQDYVDGMTNSSTGSLTRAIEVCQYLRGSCTAQATSLRNVKSALELAVVELAVTLVFDGVLAYVTFGTAELLGAAVAGGILDSINGLVAEIIAEGSELASSLGQAAQLVSRVLGAAIAAGTELVSNLGEAAPIVSRVGGTATAAGYQGLIIGMQNVVTNNALAEAFGQQETYGTAVLKAILENTWQTALGGSFTANGALNESAGILSKYLIDIGEQSDSTTLVFLGVQLKSGGITVAAADAAITQLIAHGQLNPVQLVIGTVSNRLESALGPNTGTHAKG
jgi:hypothetical protein